jgi:ring-1,2-phenylacetyl-CoA epoxidase subunit PaaC
MSTLDRKPKTRNEVLFEYLVRLADDRLILGQRLSEWCGHGPELEEDLALANIALDMIGHAGALYTYAAEIEGKGRDEDDLAFFRDDIDFKNLQMLEQPNGDFAYTIARQFLFSVYSYLLYSKLNKADDDQFRGMADKHLKEIRYHLRHSREWVLRLGDGTEESHRRIQEAFDDLWMYTGEMFDMDEVDRMAAEHGFGADLKELRGEWKKNVSEVIEEATLRVPPDDQYMAGGGRTGFHTEHLGHLLAQMQFLRRSYPDAEWTVVTGSNALLNNAAILDLDSLGITYVGGNQYSHDILIQADIISTEPEYWAQNPDVLVNEAIAFLDDETTKSEQNEYGGSGNLDPDNAHGDALQTLIG